MNNAYPSHRADVLDNERIVALSHLSHLRDLPYYLAGGTALALQLGHRQSIDFDFFGSEEFEPLTLFEKIRKLTPDASRTITGTDKNTLRLTLGDVKVSFMTYPYPLLEPTIDMAGLKIAHIRDIAMMKIQAMQQRATNKDYVDMYYILQHLSLGQLLEDMSKKFSFSFNTSLLLASLHYFDDIVEQPLVMADKHISFSFVKQELDRIVIEYQKTLLFTT